MSKVDHVIILAAGKSLQLDGISKALIRHPATGRTILEYAIDAFPGKRITVVVGFRAIRIMQVYPNLHYVHNPDWALTNNAMSLGLALDDEPAYVVSGDIFIAAELVQRLEQGAPDLVLVSDREKRSLSAIHCVLDERQRVIETYQGPVRSMAHPEAVGIFKISSLEALRAWRRRCIEHSNLFAGQLLPCDQAEIGVEQLGTELFYEVNTPNDYIELIEATRNR
jgi:choline kinase